MCSCSLSLQSTVLTATPVTLRSPSAPRPTDPCPSPSRTQSRGVRPQRVSCGRQDKSPHTQCLEATPPRSLAALELQGLNPGVSRLHSLWRTWARASSRLSQGPDAPVPLAPGPSSTFRAAVENLHLLPSLPVCLSPAHTHTRTHTHTGTYTWAHTRQHVCTRTYMCERMQMHTCQQTRTYMCEHMHRRTCTRTRVSRHAHT